MKELPDTNLRCSECKMLFSSYRLLTVHRDGQCRAATSSTLMTNTTKSDGGSKLTQDVSAVKQYFCSACDSVFLNFMKYEQHLQWHVDALDGKTESKRRKRRAQSRPMKVSSVGKGVRYECPVCRRKFREEHVAVYHGVQSHGVNLYIPTEEELAEMTRDEHRLAAAAVDTASETSSIDYTNIIVKDEPLDEVTHGDDSHDPWNSQQENDMNSSARSCLQSIITNIISYDMSRSSQPDRLRSRTSLFAALSKSIDDQGSSDTTLSKEVSTAPTITPTTSQPQKSTASELKHSCLSCDKKFPSVFALRLHVKKSH